MSFTITNSINHNAINSKRYLDQNFLLCTYLYIKVAITKIKIVKHINVIEADLTTYGSVYFYWNIYQDKSYLNINYYHKIVLCFLCVFYNIRVYAILFNHFFAKTHFQIFSSSMDFANEYNPFYVKYWRFLIFFIHNYLYLNFFIHSFVKD